MSDPAPSGPRALEGFALLGQGREAEVFAWRDGTVLRLFRDPRASPRVEREEEALRAASAEHAPVPVVYERVSIDGRPGLVMERVDGPDELHVMERRPWTFRSVARRLGALHARLHELAAPARLPALRDWLSGKIDEARLLTPDLEAFSRAVLRDLPDGDRLCHGDFHPANVLRAGNGPIVIDWTDATRGDPTGDVARTVLIMKLGALPPGGYAVLSAIMRTADRLGRGAFCRAYIGGYRRVGQIDRASMRRWMVPHAAARLAQGIKEENDSLLAFLTAEARRSG